MFIFLQGQISFAVLVPNMPERSEWRLSGQRVPLRLTGASTVAQLKARLHHALGMPPAKQKLHIDVRFYLYTIIVRNIMEELLM